MVNKNMLAKIISMDLENNEFVYFINLCRCNKLIKSIFSQNSSTNVYGIFSYRFKSILHSHFVDDLTDFYPYI